MSSSKPSIPKGTRDFGPDKMIRRNFIFSAIKTVFQKFGFLPLETPAMENLSVLMGKYGEEGDRLLFKILNSGDFVKNINLSDFEQGYKKITTSISEKGLRYDLTVPFARYVVMNRNELVFPFRRYQIQPVWRGDSPQKGRYREFYQCDADVVGTDSLICEAEIVLMINEVLENLGIKNFCIKINNRKLLTAITEKIGMPGSETDLCVAIDKLDKIGLEKVVEELTAKHFPELAIASLMPILEFSGSNSEKFKFLKNFLAGSDIGQKGLYEMNAVFEYVESFGLKENNVEFDLTLARGLSYYTGAIFEVKAKDVQIGSICGGGRYDNLTGVFGMPGISGVGISFGIDRIYDVMEELNVFPEANINTTKVLLCCFDEEAKKYSLPLLYKMRQRGINSEIYPETTKMKKQMEYADRKKIPFVMIIGSDEMTSGELMLKDMLNGEQERLNINEIIAKLC
ncbi:MAG TPA: histidine--tRNA ligase [Cytophagaceae bacterium]|jgi:histidyl-tRNA synthetase|nr:histidine--tRNA ligase [Cytophagaceae bacterium]